MITKLDFDGDQLVTQFFLSDNAINDLDKLKIEHLLKDVKASKALKFFKASQDNIKSIKEAYSLASGEIEIIDHSKDKDKFYKYAAPLDNYHEEQAKAADQFLFIKTGTANAGDIGNHTRQLFSHIYGYESIKDANIIYHELAQAALDSKAYSHQREYLTFVTESLRGSKGVDKKTLEEALRMFIPKKQTTMLIDILYDEEGNWNGGIVNMSNNLTPFSRLMYKGSLAYLHNACLTLEESLAAHLWNNI